MSSRGKFIDFARILSSFNFFLRLQEAGCGLDSGQRKSISLTASVIDAEVKIVVLVQES